MASPQITALPGTVVPSGVQVSPAGQPGPGQYFVSADAGNLAVLGSDNFISVPRSGVELIRLRSFNAIGNPTFEVDQRNVGTAVAVATGAQTPFICDRWSIFKVGTMTANAQSISSGAGTPILLPSTSFGLTQRYFAVILTAQESSLAAGDYLEINQSVEGPMLRELVSDVHSVSLLVSTNVSGGLKFAVAIYDTANNRTLCKLATAVQNAFTIITLPNLPVFASGCNLTPGSQGYAFRIGLAAGSTYMPPANDTWQSGNFVGAIGMDNFASKPVNSNFSVAFVQHEPGPVCTTLIDKPFDLNYRECLRYYQKSYDYAIAVGSATQGVNGTGSFIVLASGTSIFGQTPFQAAMAKTPTVVAYALDGTANAVRVSPQNANWGLSSTGQSTKSINQINTSTAFPANQTLLFHYTADTGW